MAEPDLGRHAVPHRDRAADGDPRHRRSRGVHAADRRRESPGVAPEDAGAASGLVNVAHQLGGSLGLGVLVTVFASAAPSRLDARDVLAERISTSLTAGAVMLAIALAVVCV